VGGGLLTYLIAAYAVSIGAVALYLVHLARERQQLARELAPERRGEPAPRPAAM
jgi:CcmD family protein